MKVITEGDPAQIGLNALIEAVGVGNIVMIINAPASKTEIDFQNQPNGIYIMHVEGSEWSVTERVVLTK